MAERRQHFQERQVAEQAGDDRSDRDDQKRIEPQREPDDDQRDAEEGPIIDHSPLLPNPPPPGVSITNRSPGRTSA